MTEVDYDAKYNDGPLAKPQEFETPEQLYQELISRVKTYHPSDDVTAISKAYETARKAHEGQTRKSGEPYIIHPLCVASILAELELDKETIIAGLLHDVVEDTVMSLDDIREKFGDEVALLVDGVTKLKSFQISTRSRMSSGRGCCTP